MQPPSPRPPKVGSESDSLNLDSPKSDAPQPAASESEAPKSEAPQPVAPTSDSPELDAHESEVPKSDPPKWQWPSWKFGLQDEYLDKLYKDCNLVKDPMPILDMHAWHHDVAEVAIDTPEGDTEAFYAALAKRCAERRAELNGAWSAMSRQLGASPQRFATKEQHEAFCNMNRHWTLDSIILFFETFLDEQFRTGPRGPSILPSSSFEPHLRNAPPPPEPRPAPEPFVGKTWPDPEPTEKYQPRGERQNAWTKDAIYKLHPSRDALGEAPSPGESSPEAAPLTSTDDPLAQEATRKRQREETAADERDKKRQKQDEPVQVE